MEYVYLLALRGGQIYTGRSGNLERRITDHRYGKVISTRYKRPLILIGYEVYAIKTDAIRR